ncbi:RIKEN cDNA 2610017I09, isoform CRA_a [Mus musculus]|nr:RIKEN cDNA 2610017I09, isoform CRA_a [Mus musculus]
MPSLLPLQEPYFFFFKQKTKTKNKNQKPKTNHHLLFKSLTWELWGEGTQ